MAEIQAQAAANRHEVAERANGRAADMAEVQAQAAADRREHQSTLEALIAAIAELNGQLGDDSNNDEESPVKASRRNKTWC